METHPVQAAPKLDTPPQVETALLDTSASEAVKRSGIAARLVAYLELTKPRIIELLLVTAVPAMVVAARGLPPAEPLFGCLAGGFLSAGGANAMNMVLDRDIDTVMRRTKKRPLVRGDLTVLEAVLFAVAIEIAGVATLAATCGMLSALLSLSAALFYVLIYTVLLKRRSTQNIVIGGAAGAAPPLVAWAGVTHHLALPAFLMFLIVFLWTPPHFWSLALAYKDDYAAVEVPMLPTKKSPRSVALQCLFYAVLTSGAAVALYFVSRVGLFYLVVAALSSAIFLALCASLLSDSSRKTAMRVFAASIAYLAVIFLAMAASVFISRFG